MNTSITVSHIYKDTIAHNYTVTLIVLDSLKDTIVYNYNLIDTISTACRMDYSISAPKVVPNPYSLSNVTINYVDGNGNHYTSDNLSQSNTSTFQITSVSNYQNNINNNPTKMLKVTFNCLLFPVISGPPILQAMNCTAIIAVAYH
jgi:hypothetical protein